MIDGLSTTLSPSPPNFVTLTPGMSCNSSFPEIGSYERCQEAAEDLARRGMVDIAFPVTPCDTTGFANSSTYCNNTWINVTTTSELPWGCYYKGVNRLGLRLWWNTRGNRSHSGADPNRIMICGGPSASPTVAPTTTPPTGSPTSAPSSGPSVAPVTSPPSVGPTTLAPTNVPTVEVVVVEVDSGGTPPVAPSESNDDGGFPVAVVAGIVGGCLLILIVMVVIAVMVRSRKKAARDPDASESMIIGKSIVSPDIPEVRGGGLSPGRSPAGGSNWQHQFGPGADASLGGASINTNSTLGSVDSNMFSSSGASPVATVIPSATLGHDYRLSAVPTTPAGAAGEPAARTGHDYRRTGSGSMGDALAAAADPADRTDGVDLLYEAVPRPPSSDDLPIYDAQPLPGTIADGRWQIGHDYATKSSAGSDDPPKFQPPSQTNTTDEPPEYVPVMDGSSGTAELYALPPEAPSDRSTNAHRQPVFFPERPGRKHRPSVDDASQEQTGSGEYGFAKSAGTMDSMYAEAKGVANPVQPRAAAAKAGVDPTYETPDYEVPHSAIGMDYERTGAALVFTPRSSDSNLISVHGYDRFNDVSLAAKNKQEDASVTGSSSGSSNAGYATIGPARSGTTAASHGPSNPSHTAALAAGSVAGAPIYGTPQDARPATTLVDAGGYSTIDAATAKGATNGAGTAGLPRTKSVHEYAEVKPQVVYTEAPPGTAGGLAYATAGGAARVESEYDVIVNPVAPGRSGSHEDDSAKVRDRGSVSGSVVYATPPGTLSSSPDPVPKDPVGYTKVVKKPTDQRAIKRADGATDASGGLAPGRESVVIADPATSSASSSDGVVLAANPDYASVGPMFLGGGAQLGLTTETSVDGVIIKMDPNSTYAGIPPQSSGQA